MKVKHESEHAGLKFSIQKTKIMATSPITSWQIDGETMETVRDFFWGHKITADGDCSHEIKRHLILGRKDVTNLDNVLKSRDITLPTKVPIVRAMVYPVIMYGCESWTIKKAKRQSWIWNSDAVTTSGIKPARILKVKLQFFGHLTAKNQFTGEDTDDGKDWGQEGKKVTEDKMTGWHQWLNGHEFEQTLRDREGQGSRMCCSSWGHKESDMI